MRHFLLIAALLCCCPAAKASISLANYGTCANLIAGATSATCNFTGVVNPDVGIIVSWGTAGGAGNIATVSGCGNSNWSRMYAADFSANEQDLFVSAYLTPGSCSVTVTYFSGQNRTLIAQGEYVGVAAAPIAYIGAGGSSDVRIPSQIGGPAVIPFQTYEPNDFVVMIGSSYNNCEGGNFISTAGVALTAHAPIYSSYPCPPVPFGGDSAVIQFLDASISAQGSYSSTVGNVMGGNSYIFPFVLRSQMPSGPAVLQSFPCSSNELSGSTTLTCQPIVPRVSSSTRWVVMIETRELDSVLTDSLGDCTGKHLPSYWGNATLAFATFCDDSTLGRPVFTLTSASNEQGDVVVEEVQNVATVDPLYAGHAWTNVYASNIGPNVTTQDNGPLSLPGGQCFLLTGFSGAVTNMLYTASTGYNLRGGWAVNYDSTIQNTWDQQVCPSVLTTAYDFTITAPTAQGGIETGMWALGGISNSSFPVVAQALPAQPNSAASTVPLNNPVESGDIITICAGGNSAHGLGITSSPSLTWTLAAGGGPSDTYADWSAPVTFNGSLSLTFSATWGGGGFIDTAILDNRFITAFDAGNSNFSGTGTSPLSTGNITTTGNNDWLVSCATNMGATTSSFALPTNNLWSLNQYYPTDGGYVDSWTMVAGAPGAYSNSFTYATAQPSSATIFGFRTDIPPPPSTTQPHVTIALNGKDIPAYQIGAQ